MDWINDFRYDHPGMFWSFTGAASLVLGGCIFFLLPANEFFRTVGVTSMQQRVDAFRRAIYWQARATVHASAGEAAPTVLYGNLLGIEADTSLIVSIPAGEAYEQRRLLLADVVVHDVHAAARTIARHRLSPAKFDVYGSQQAVVWIDQAPLNVRLIEEGAATPDPNPPTNIVDVAFARYYWNLAKGNAQ